jgi:hypothetical protein
MDAMANGVIIEPEKSRVKLAELLEPISTEDLLKVVSEYNVWLNSGRWSLIHTIAHDIWQEHFTEKEPNRYDGPLWVYDGIGRELARRLRAEQKIKQDYSNLYSF